MERFYLRSSGNTRDVVAAKLLLNLFDGNEDVQRQLISIMEKKDEKFYMLFPSEIGVSFISLPDSMYTGGIKTIGDRIEPIVRKTSEEMMTNAIMQMLLPRTPSPRESMEGLLDFLMSGGNAGIPKEFLLNQLSQLTDINTRTENRSNDGNSVNNSVNIIGNHINGTDDDEVFVPVKRKRQFNKTTRTIVG